MISSVATYSLDQARKHWAQSLDVLRGFEREGLHLTTAWVGFDTCEHDRSPLRDIAVGQRLVVRCIDWDVDGRHSPAHVGYALPVDAPTLDHAREIVRFVLALHNAPGKYRLAVHCHAGLFRSGAVAEWVRSDLGAFEPPTSNRLVDVIGETPEQRTFNAGLLRMLREAHAEAW